MSDFMEKIKHLSDITKVEDIEFRVQSVNDGGYATILAYKDARYDMKRLDEVVGHLNWQKQYKILDGDLYCAIGIYNPEIKEWIWKSDVGTESMAEAKKGRASDAFKRAGFNWGIGRDLYDYPVMRVKLKKSEVTTSGGKTKTSYSFNLKSWKWIVERSKSDGSIIVMGFQKSGNSYIQRFSSLDPEHEKALQTVTNEKILALLK